MKNLMKLTLAAALTATTAFAADLYTGTKGYNYHDTVGPSLAKNTKGVQLNVIEGLGSKGNMDAIIGTPHFALAQANVSNPLINNDDKYASLDVIGTVGMECGFLVVPTSNNNGRTVPTSLSDLAGEKITIGKAGSGDNFSFNQLVAENPTLKALEISPRSSSLRMLGKVASGYQGAAFFFSVPDKNNKLIKEVLSNPKVTFADAEDINLGSLAEGKRPALFMQDLTIGKHSFTTMCTNINIMADVDVVNEAHADAVYEASKTTRTHALTVSGALSETAMKAAAAYSKVLNFFNK